MRKAWRSFTPPMLWNCVTKIVEATKMNKNNEQRSLKKYIVNKKQLSAVVNRFTRDSALSCLFLYPLIKKLIFFLSQEAQSSISQNCFVEVT